MTVCMAQGADNFAQKHNLIAELSFILDSTHRLLTFFDGLEQHAQMKDMLFSKSRESLIFTGRRSQRQQTAFTLQGYFDMPQVAGPLENLPGWQAP